MPKIEINSDKNFESTANQTILDAAKNSKIGLEHSCRTGRCGVCKVRVISGLSHAVKSDESLTDQDKQNGFILTCSYAADSDLRLDTDDLGRIGQLETKTLPCKIDTIVSLAPDVLEVTLRTPPSSKLAYIPGQYIDVIAMDAVRRSYSLSNAPRQDGKLALHIRKVADGVMSEYWFEKAKANDLLRIEGPLGTFCVRDNSKTNLVFLATGTGIAPIKAVLEEISSTDATRFNNIYLYWGGRTAVDFYWTPEFENLPLRYLKVFSSGQAESETKKHYVQHAVLADELDLSTVTVYACGAERMISDAKKLLVEHGLEPNHFYSDAFVSSN